MRRLLLGVVCGAFLFFVSGGAAALADNMPPPPPPQNPPPPPPPQHSGGGVDSPGVVVFTPQVPPQEFAPSTPKQSTPRSPSTPAGQDFAANLPADTTPAVNPAVALAGEPPPAGKTVFNVSEPPDPNAGGGDDPNIPLVAALGLVGVAIAAAPDPTKKAECDALAARAAKARGVQVRAAAKLSQEEMGMSTLDAEASQAKSTLQSLNQNLADAAADPNRGDIATIMGQVEAQKAVVAAADAKIAVSQTLQEKYRNAMARAVQVQAAAGRDMAAKGCTQVAGIDMGGDVDEYAV